MKKIYVCKEYGISDYEEFCHIDLFTDKEMAKEYLKNRVAYELAYFKENDYKINYTEDECKEEDILVTKNTDTHFQMFIYGYGCDYSINIEIEDMEVV